MGQQARSTGFLFRAWYYLLAGVISLLFAGLIGMELYTSRQAALQAAQTRNASIASIMADRFAARLNEIDYILRDVHDYVRPEHLVFHHDPEDPVVRGLNQLLERKRVSHPLLISLGVQNRDGIFVGGVTNGGDFTYWGNFSWREYFDYLYTHQDKDRYCSPGFVEIDTLKRWISCTRTLRRANGQFSGAIFAGISLDALVKEYGQIDFAEGGTVTIVDREMKILTRSPMQEAMIGKKIDSPELRALMGSAANVLSTEGFSPLDGKLRLMSFQRLNDLNYVVAVTSDKVEDLATWHKKAWIYTAGWVLITALIMLGVWAFTRIRNLAGQLAKWNAALRDNEKKLKLLASTDPLTGAGNRRHLMERGKEEVLRARRYRDLSVLMLDIDHFKRINDGYGHASGDRVLCAFVECCKLCLREVDQIGRYGGEEFVIVLPSTALAGAEEVAERLRAAVETLGIEAEGGEIISLTVSIGVATLWPDINNFEIMISRADVALYQAKEGGRNRVCTYGGPEPHASS